jgi:hypothetical protein
MKNDQFHQFSGLLFTLFKATQEKKSHLITALEPTWAVDENLIYYRTLSPFLTSPVWGGM